MPAILSFPGPTKGPVSRRLSALSTTGGRVSGRPGEDLCYPAPQDRVQGAGDGGAGCPFGGPWSGHPEAFEGADGGSVFPD